MAKQNRPYSIASKENKLTRELRKKAENGYGSVETRKPRRRSSVGQHIVRR